MEVVTGKRDNGPQECLSEGISGKKSGFPTNVGSLFFGTFIQL
jgi:hypothetical protein